MITSTKYAILASLILACAASAANAQSRNWSRQVGNESVKQGGHWCQWSAATVCTRWRARGGKFICPPGNNSMSCRLQRGEVKLR
jgi:hypothetical protein